MTAGPQTLADLLCAYVSEQCTVILDAEAPLRAGEDVVHVTRVALRRLRSTLRVFAEAFDVAQAGRCEDELVWWAGLLGEVRDADILLAGLTARIAQLPPELVLGPVQSAIETETAARRKAGMDAVLAAMDSDRYRALVDLLQAWREDPPLGKAAQEPAGAVKGYVKKADRKLRRRLASAVAARKAGAEEADELFHSARKAGKRHRYAVELAQPLWGAKADKVVAARKALQDVLGAHQDRAVATVFLQELGGRLGVRCGVNGFSYGLLHARVSAEGDRLVRDLKPYL